MRRGRVEGPLTPEASLWGPGLVIQPQATASCQLSIQMPLVKDTFQAPVWQLGT